MTSSLVPDPHPGLGVPDRASATRSHAYACEDAGAAGAAGAAADCPSSRAAAAAGEALAVAGRAQNPGTRPAGRDSYRGEECSPAV